MQRTRSLEALSRTGAKAKIYINYYPQIAAFQKIRGHSEYFKAAVVGIDQEKVRLEGRLKLLKMYKNKIIRKVRLRRSISEINISDIVKIRI